MYHALAATAPLVITAASLCTPQYVCDYVKHVGLIREMLGQASLSENPAVLAKCNSKLLKSIAGLLRGDSNCPLTREPIPAWSAAKVVRTKTTAELVAKTTSLMIHDANARLICRVHQCLSQIRTRRPQCILHWSPL